MAQQTQRAVLVRDHRGGNGESLVREIVLNRPEKRNALNGAMVDEIEEALDDLRGSGVTCLLLTGSAPAFCAGSDLGELAPMSPVEMGSWESRKGALVHRIANLPVPVVCAVEGYALGGGLALALAADVIVAGESAWLHFPEVTNGWIPPWGLSLVQRRVTPSAAVRVVWGARRMSGSEAQAAGLVDHVVADGSAGDAALQEALLLADLPSEAVTAVKHVLGSGAPANDHVLRQLFELHSSTGTAARATFERFGTRAAGRKEDHTNE